MNKKKTFIYTLAALLLGALFYTQFRTWRGFDWSAFGKETANVKSHLLNVFLGVACTYFAYVLRAVRWKIFLRPVKNTSSRELLAPTVIGFTGLSLLGRPGEFIRPYLIARRVNLSFSSQVAVWTVERIFDVGSFGVLFTIALLNPETRALLSGFHIGKFALLALAIGISCLVLLVMKGESLASWISTRFSGFAPKLGELAAARIREFSSGLNTIHDASSFAQLVAVSVVMWTMIALAYWQVMLSYGVAVLDRPKQIPLVMASSMLGSVIQLPGVGGGSQLATIFTMQTILSVPRELAVSCGLLLWAVTFMSVIPWGLFLAHRERLSLRRLSAESQEEEQGAIEGPAIHERLGH
jgi:glycosyltransferase 2 family protein